jgi:hypothetical protein
VRRPRPRRATGEHDNLRAPLAEHRGLRRPGAVHLSAAALEPRCPCIARDHRHPGVGGGRAGRRTTRSCNHGLGSSCGGGRRRRGADRPFPARASACAEHARSCAEAIGTPRCLVASAGGRLGRRVFSGRSGTRCAPRAYASRFNKRVTAGWGSAWRTRVARDSGGHLPQSLAGPRRCHDCRRRTDHAGRSLASAFAERDAPADVGHTQMRSSWWPQRNAGM